MFFTRDTEGRLAHLSGAGKKCRHRQLLLGLLAMIKSRASTHSCSSRCCIPRETSRLRVLHELGGDAAASLLAAAKAHVNTPAHLAAQEGHEGCLRVLHELGGDL